MESELGIVDYIGTKLELAMQKTQEKTGQMHMMLAYFQAVKRDMEHFGKSLQKSLSAIKEAYPLSDAYDEWDLGFQKVMILSDELIQALAACFQNLGTEVAQPFEGFIGEYDQFNRGVFKDSIKVRDLLTTHRERINRAKERYYRDLKVSGRPTESKEDYRQLVNSLNTFIDKNKESYTKGLESLVQTEEKRLVHIKDTFTRFAEISSALSRDCAEFCSHSQKIFNSTSTTLDPKDYMENPGTLRSHLFDKVDFATAASDAEQEEQKVRSISRRIVPNDQTFVEKAFNQLLGDDVIPPAEKDRLVDYTRFPEGRRLLCSAMSMLARKYELNSQDAFDTLGEIALGVINASIEQETLESDQLTAVLSLGGLVANVRPPAESGQKAKKYLREVLSTHTIWYNKDVWPKVLDYKIAKALKYLHAYTQMRLAKKTAGKEIGLMEKFTRAMGKKDAETLKNEEQEQTSKKGVAFSELTSTALEMALLSVDTDVTRDLIIGCAKRYDLDNDKLYQLLCDYECAQPLPRDEDPRQHEKLSYSLDKRVREQKRYGYTKSTMIIGMTIKFVSDFKTLSGILLLNKDFNTKFKAKVYKHVLRRAQEKSRFGIWLTLLSSRGLNNLYLKLKSEEIPGFKVKHKYVDDIIRMDVIRSFHVHSETDQLAIMDILRCYAITNSEVEYCQGMNCIAGLFFLIYRDEGTAFNMLTTLIANFGLFNLFKQDVPLLRMYFYQMNRLLAVYLPRLHAHLFEEGINATYFCSPWFLTAFTYVLQFAKTPAIPPLLCQIFDGFLSVLISVMIT
ncbi:MAG: TBC domain-containing protein [Candidatus Pacebacteria bacterium]|nr:TBC domain-containing protein [Candidatus Paceibacterota bacterium]